LMREDDGGKGHVSDPEKEGSSVGERREWSGGRGWGGKQVLGTDIGETGEASKRTCGIVFRDKKPINQRSNGNEV